IRDLVGNRLARASAPFQAASNLSAGTSPRSVAAGDVNADGKPDLIVANNGDSTVGVLLGNGNGTFQAPPNFPHGPGPPSLAAAAAPARRSWRSGISRATASPTSPSPTTATARWACCWATATAPSRHPRLTRSPAARTPLQWRTSTATAGLTLSPPTLPAAAR